MSNQSFLILCHSLLAFSFPSGAIRLSLAKFKSYFLLIWSLIRAISLS
uniref:Uncharacterized protein n=1 Tax=Dulem virus 42 TaxID=3145760 RepID=A0AAU8BBT8_9CAUD